MKKAPDLVEWNSPCDLKMTKKLEQEIEALVQAWLDNETSEYYSVTLVNEKGKFAKMLGFHRAIIHPVFSSNSWEEYHIALGEWFRLVSSARKRIVTNNSAFNFRPVPFLPRNTIEREYLPDAGLEISRTCRITEKVQKN